MYIYMCASYMPFYVFIVVGQLKYGACGPQDISRN